MHLYFFDLDDTICNTKKLIQDFIAKNQIDVDSISRKTLDDMLIKYIKEVGFHNIEPLENSTMLLLRQLLKTKKEDVFYITARTGDVREESIVWLKKYNLFINDEKLIMDTEGIKGKVINDILINSSKQFAFFFDDLESNHLEAAKYKNIISCLPY